MKNKIFGRGWDRTSFLRFICPALRTRRSETHLIRALNQLGLFRQFCFLYDKAVYVQPKANQLHGPNGPRVRTQNMFEDNYSEDRC